MRHARIVVLQLAALASAPTSQLVLSARRPGVPKTATVRPDTHNDVGGSERGASLLRRATKARFVATFLMRQVRCDRRRFHTYIPMGDYAVDWRRRLRVVCVVLSLCPILPRERLLVAPLRPAEHCHTYGELERNGHDTKATLPHRELHEAGDAAGSERPTMPFRLGAVNHSTRRIVILHSFRFQCSTSCGVFRTAERSS